MATTAQNLAHVNDINFKTEVIDSEVPVLVDFWAEWCGPCRMLTPIIETLAGKYVGRAKVVKVNTDESPMAAALYEISAIPTVILFYKGSVLNRAVGVQPKEVYERLIESATHS
ncbi:MAG: thioredoxin [Fibrobacterota bacterium]